MIISEKKEKNQISSKLDNSAVYNVQREENNKKRKKIIK